MLERGCSLGNTIGPNALTDDKTALSYYALAKCIVGIEYEGKIKYPSIKQACSAFKLSEQKTNTEDPKIVNKKRYNKRLKFIVENLMTGEKITCNGVKEVADRTGMTETHVSSYARKEVVYQKTWKIYKVNKNKIANNSRYMQITNIENGQVREFESLKETANFLGKATSTIIYHVERKSLVCGWKVEYLD
jgi:hypothetical protein